MTQVEQLYIGMGVAFVFAIFCFRLMMYFQKKKEEEAKRQFDLTMETMRARGVTIAREQMRKKK